MKCLHIFFLCFPSRNEVFIPVVLTGIYSSRDENYSHRKRVNVRDISPYNHIDRDNFIPGSNFMRKHPLRGTMILTVLKLLDSKLKGSFQISNFKLILLFGRVFDSKFASIVQALILHHTTRNAEVLLTSAKMISSVKI